MNFLVETLSRRWNDVTRLESKMLSILFGGAARMKKCLEMFWVANKLGVRGVFAF